MSSKYAELSGVYISKYLPLQRIYSVEENNCSFTTEDLVRIYFGFVVAECRQFIYFYITVTKFKTSVDHTQARGWGAKVLGLTQLQVFNVKCLLYIIRE